ncbi:DUF3103 family protein [Chitinivorax sp. B]|uniref:DUF3103 family protein n=1 Tax=Chitinivorax sp. B TaxID=2502235 RepID=UPI001484CA2B|nr:DUF3103 family protein [Chitinivorax sp. B]
MAFPLTLRQILIGAFSLAAVSTVHADEPTLQPQTVLPGQPTHIDQAKRETARQVARMLADPTFANSLNKQLAQTPDTAPNKVAPLRLILDEYSRNAPRSSVLSRHMGLGMGSVQALRQLDQSVLNKKGITGISKGLLQVRLFEPKQRAMMVQPTNQMLVAFEPAGDDKQWTVIEAFDSQGRIHYLDARQAPNFPVLVADIDGREDLRAGLQIANRTLAAKGMQKHAAVSDHKMMAMSGYVDTARLDRIRLNRDEEPWISGAAEVYALVSGVQPGQSKAQIEAVELPYLDHDGRDYTPNQILIQWADFRYAAANVQFFEHDDNTNYKDLVLAVTSGVEKILGAFKPEYAVIATVANAIIQAMPSHWFTNDDDYLDSFYTLEKNRTYTDWMGAANNAKITLTPYRLNEQ